MLLIIPYPFTLAWRGSGMGPCPDLSGHLLTPQVSDLPVCDALFSWKGQFDPTQRIFNSDSHK